MSKYASLSELRLAFTNALQKAELSAKTEQDYDAITEIAVDFLNSIPTSLVQTDFVERRLARTYLDDKDKKDTAKITKFMLQIWNDDVVRLDDDNLCDDLQCAAEKFYKSGFTIEAQTAKGKFYGYVAEHPEEPGLPYYSEEPDDAIIFETMQKAQEWIATNSEGTDFNFIIINKKD